MLPLNAGVKCSMCDQVFQLGAVTRHQSDTKLPWLVASGNPASLKEALTSALCQNCHGFKEGVSLLSIVRKLEGGGDASASKKSGAQGGVQLVRRSYANARPQTRVRYVDPKAGQKPAPQTRRPSTRPHARSTFTFGDAISAQLDRSVGETGANARKQRAELANLGAQMGVDHEAVAKAKRSNAGKFAARIGKAKRILAELENVRFVQRAHEIETEIEEVLVQAVSFDGKKRDLEQLYGLLCKDGRGQIEHLAALTYTYVSIVPSSDGSTSRVEVRESRLIMESALHEDLVTTGRSASFGQEGLVLHESCGEVQVHRTHPLTQILPRPASPLADAGDTQELLALPPTITYETNSLFSGDPVLVFEDDRFQREEVVFDEGRRQKVSVLGKGSRARMIHLPPNEDVREHTWVYAPIVELDGRQRDDFDLFYVKRVRRNPQGDVVETTFEPLQSSPYPIYLNDPIMMITFYDPEGHALVTVVLDTVDVGYGEMRGIARELPFTLNMGEDSVLLAGSRSLDAGSLATSDTQPTLQ